MEDEIIKKAVEALKKGEVIIYPTESCYSFGCDAENESAVRKIHDLKQENYEKPITLSVSNLEQIKKYGILNNSALKLSHHFMPGRINLIISAKNPKKYNYLSRNGIAFRIPANIIAFKISDMFDHAITTTSVNIHGQPSIYNILELKKLFGDKISFIIDSGDLNDTIPQSTVFDTRTNKTVLERGIKTQEIYRALKH